MDDDLWEFLAILFTPWWILLIVLAVIICIAVF